MSDHSDLKDDDLNEKFKILLDDDIEIKKWNEGLLIKSFIHFFCSTNWNSDTVLSKLIHKNMDSKKLVIEVKIATYLEFFSTFFCVPFVIKIKRAPIKGINIIADRIGKFI